MKDGASYTAQLRMCCIKALHTIAHAQCTCMMHMHRPGLQTGLSPWPGRALPNRKTNNQKHMPLARTMYSNWSFFTWVIPTAQITHVVCISLGRLYILTGISREGMPAASAIKDKTHKGMISWKTLSKHTGSAGSILHIINLLTN